MPIKRVWITDGCTACGVCENTCPEVFEVSDIAIVKKGVDFTQYEDEIEEAADNCPVEVIEYE